MFVRIAPFALLAAAAVIACTAESTTPTSSSSSSSSSGSSGKTGGTSSSSSGSTGKTPTEKDAGPTEPADPACVSACESSLKTKCEGDETFCEDICLAYSKEVVDCVAGKPTCEKTEFSACLEANPGK